MVDGLEVCSACSPRRDVFVTAIISELGCRHVREASTVLHIGLLVVVDAPMVGWVDVYPVSC